MKSPWIVQTAGPPAATGMALSTRTAMARASSAIAQVVRPLGGGSPDDREHEKARRMPAVRRGDPIRLLEALAPRERALAGRRSSLSAERISAAPHSVTTGTSHRTKAERQCKRFPPRPHPELHGGAEVSSSGRGCGGGCLGELLTHGAASPRHMSHTPIRIACKLQVTAWVTSVPLSLRLANREPRQRLDSTYKRAS